MSDDVYGFVLIKASKEVMAALVSDGRESSWETMDSLAKEAEFNRPLEDCHEMLWPLKGRKFPNDEVKLSNGYIVITCYGKSWMYLLEPLARRGKNIEVYACIFHDNEYDYSENSCYEHYALDNNGEKYSGKERGKWLVRVPKLVQETFSSLFLDTQYGYN